MLLPVLQLASYLASIRMRMTLSSYFKNYVRNMHVIQHVTKSIYTHTSMHILHCRSRLK